MRKLLLYIPAVLQFTAIFLLFSVACVSSEKLPANEPAGQWWWMARAGIFYVVCLGVSIVFNRRSIASRTPEYSNTVIWTLIILANYEAVSGLWQLYDFGRSNHSLFSLTGTFFNPGPYSGYLAMIFPLCLNECFRLKKKVQAASSSGITVAKAGYYYSLFVLLLIVVVLPSGMSRTAWLAAGVSGLFVAGWHCGWGTRLKDAWRRNRVRVTLWAMAGCLCLCIGLAALYLWKKDSANGRLFMWKISLNAIARHPLTGHGAGSFPAAYGDAQEAYFAAGDYAEWEEYVAGSPEYAFNEYLQVAVEQGIPVLLLCLTVAGFCFREGMKKGRIGICGGLLSLAVFAFASYPLRLPAFIIAFIFLLFACVVDEKPLPLLLFALGIGVWSLYLWKTSRYEAVRQWKESLVYYQTGAYEHAKERYAPLYPALKKQPGFMFEYGRCLHMLGEYDASGRILREASLLTNDPMVLNLIGKNHQMKREYEEAERYYLRSLNRLPGRMYPYYLLAGLYAEPGFRQPQKFEHAFQVLMTKRPKVESTAIREMREEVQQLREELYDVKE